LVHALSMRSTLFPYTTLFRSVGDVKAVLTDMLEIIGDDKELEQHALLDWWSQINEWRTRHGLRYDTNTDNGIKPQAVVQALDKRSEEHTSELQSRFDLVCRLL